ncbi:hypothetical protein MKX01_012527 [Papaver californicum]|nr:hypothetical protein MKX01_012527 [Papaver californicum]
MNFGFCCRKKDQRSERKLPPLPKAAPWLVYPHGKDKKIRTFYNLCDPKSRSYQNVGEPMVFFLCIGVGPKYMIVFCSVDDTEWCKHKLIHKSPQKIYLFSGKLYAMCLNNKLLKIEIQHVSDTNSEKTLSISKFNIAQTDGMSLYRYEVDDNSMLLYLPCPSLPSPWFSSNWVMIPTTKIMNFDLIQKTQYIKCKKDEEGSTRKAKESKINVKNEEDDLRQKLEGGELKEARAWGNLLPNDILCLLGSYLHTLDYIHWHAISKTAYNFFNPLHNEKYLMNIPELLNGATVRSSRGGWLLISKGRTLTIKLPNLPDDKEYVYSVISFSSVPTSPDCLVFGITTFLSYVLILSIKRGDASWTFNMLDNIPPNRKDVCEISNCSNRAFYCLDCNGTLGVYDGNDISWETLVNVPPPNCNFIYKSFLVECGGELLSVFLGNFGKWVRVFKLDMSGSVWIEVKHLGKHMLCISNTLCISAFAPNSRMENKIYFPRSHKGEIFYYSLETGTYNSFSSRSSLADFYDSTEYLSCSWIEPNWSETTVHDLDWLSN